MADFKLVNLMYPSPGQVLEFLENLITVNIDVDLIHFLARIQNGLLPLDLLLTGPDYSEQVWPHFRQSV